MAEQNRPGPKSPSYPNRMAQAGGFTLRAVDSAERMTQALSPWVREMLDSSSAPTDGGSLVHRLMRRRADESVSFLSTLAILKRFHRIATRTSSWKADVGTISPNLFEKFSEEMLKNWDMGANNITALLKINRQEEAIDMPLAGESGEPSPRPQQAPANQTPAMTMEEIRRRVAEARNFESLSPAAVPNFVKAQDGSGPPEVRPVAQHPASRPTPAPPRPTDQPIARSLSDRTAPSGPQSPQPPAQKPTEQPAQPAPRMMRRRMARKVEYLSMPASDGKDDGESEGADDSDAGPAAHFDTGPPNLDWLFPSVETAQSDWFAPSETHSVRWVDARRSTSPSRATVANRSTQKNPRQTTTQKRSPRPAGVQGVMQRSIQRLAASTSGRLLASRPYLLLDHLQTQSNAPAPAPAPIPQPTAEAHVPGDGLSTLNPATAQLSFGPQQLSEPPRPRAQATGSTLLPVSLEDFALPHFQRIRQQRTVPQTGQSADATSLAGMLPTNQTQTGQAQPSSPQAQPGQTAQPARRTGRASFRVDRSTQSPRTAPTRPERAPVAPTAALAALQIRPLHTPPTVMRLAPVPAPADHLEDHPRNNPYFPWEPLTETDSDERFARSSGQPLADSQPPTELQPRFEPVSGLWRASQLRRQPVPTLQPQSGGHVSQSGLADRTRTSGLAGVAQASPQATIPDQFTPSRPVAQRVARTVLPPVELALARFRRRAEQAHQPLNQPVGRVSDEPGRTAPSVRDVPSLGERLIRRDFARTRRDSLTAGLLALSPDQTMQPSIERSHPDPVRAFSPSPRDQTRQLIQRAQATDGWNPQEMATFARRPQGLRTPVPGQQGSLARQPQATGNRLGTVAVAAQGQTVTRGNLEPVSRLWRGAMLTPDIQRSPQSFLANPAQWTGAPTGNRTFAPRTTPDRFTDTPLPLVPLRIAREGGGAGVRSRDRVGSGGDFVDVNPPASPTRSSLVNRDPGLPDPVGIRPTVRPESTLTERLLERSFLPRHGRPFVPQPTLQRTLGRGANTVGANTAEISRPGQRPGETGRAAATMSQERRRASAIAPVSAAWLGDFPAGEVTNGLPNARESFVQTFPAVAVQLPVPVMPRALQGSDLPLRRAPLVANRPDGVQSAVARPEVAQPGVAQPGVVQRQVAASSVVPTRPLSYQVLSRDFAHTRRDLLQQETTRAIRAQQGHSAMSDANSGGRGAEMTTTLLALARQPAYRVGLPPSRYAQVQRQEQGVLTDTALPHTGNQADAGKAQPSPLHPGAVARAAGRETLRRQQRHRLEPVSALWHTDLLDDESAMAPVGRDVAGRDVAGPVALSADDLLGGFDLQRSPGDSTDSPASPAPAHAVFAPLELSLRRLLGNRATGGASPRGETRQDEDRGVEPRLRQAASPDQPARPSARIGPRQNVVQVVNRLEAGGWRFKRSRSQPPAAAHDVQRTLATLSANLSAEKSRPIPVRQRTLLERVLQRDFAGVRVKMASLGPLGIEAAARGTTVYLNRARARLDSPDSLALLGHELTHVAASGAAPLRGTENVQRVEIRADLPLARPLAPSLTQRLSRQFVQMSLAEEETAAVQVENAVRRGVAPHSAARTSGARVSGRRPVGSRASIDQGSHSTARLAQRRMERSRFSPVSQSWPVQGLAPVAESAAATVDLLETQGWRFKRGPRASNADGAAVQRATAELTARPGGALPLPVRPRTLMERVLQRDFSGVRLQAAGLDALGVEAAAHGQTVYMQRSTLAQLDRPDNLALLGHELTHVAAGTNPTVRRSEAFGGNGDARANGDAGANGATTGVLPLSLPPQAQLQRSVRHEENAAAQVEQGIQSLLRQNATVQRDPLEPRPSNGPVKAQSPAAPITRRQSSVGRPVGFARVTGVETPVQRDEDESSVLSGVSSEAMPVVQRLPARVGAVSASPPASVQREPEMLFARATQATPVEQIQRADNSNLNDGLMDESLRDYEMMGDGHPVQEEPDWDRLADRIYPLIVRMLKLDRERRPF